MFVLGAGAQQGLSLSAGVPPPAFKLQPSPLGPSQVASPRLKQPSPTSEPAQYSRMGSGQVRDAPLLQVSSAQMSRSSSHKSASPRPAVDDSAVNTGSGLTSEPTLANFANVTEAASAATDTGNVQQPTEGFDNISGLLAAVDALTGLSLTETEEKFDADNQTAASGITSVSDSVQDLLRQSTEQLPGIAGAPGPDIFFSMPTAVPVRTRSNLRTGSMTLNTAAGGLNADASAHTATAGNPVSITHQLNRGVVGKHDTPSVSLGGAAW